MRWLCLIILALFSKSLFAEARFTLEDALHQTLENQWNIYISEMDVENERGLLKQAKAPFDPVLAMSLSQNLFTDYSAQHAYTFPDGTAITLPIIGTITAKDPGGFKFGGYISSAKASLLQRTRIGTEFLFGTELTKEKNPYQVLEDCYPLYYDFNVPYIRSGVAKIFFTINQPLLKGFIYGSNVVAERNKELLVSAFENSFIHNISVQLLSTIDAYFDFLMAQKLLDERKKSESEVLRYYNSIEAFIEGNILAQTEISQALRSLSEAKADVILAEQDITRAAQQLIVAIGSKEDYSYLCSEKLRLDEWPKSGEKVKDFCKVDMIAAINFAIEHRYDVKAIELKEKAIDIQIKGAFNEILPQLNLALEGKKNNSVYESDAKTFFDSYNFKAPEKELTLSLSLNFPLFSSLGRGKLISARADKHKTNFQLEQLKANIFSDVVKALNDYQTILIEMKQVDIALASATKYVQDQEILLKEGMTSVFQLLDSHSKLVLEEIRKIAIETRKTKNIAKIKYLLGLLVKREEQTGRFAIQNVFDMPQFIFENMRKS